MMEGPGWGKPGMESCGTDHSLPQPGPPDWGWGGVRTPAASLLPGLDGSALQRQPSWWAKGRVEETGGNP